MAFIWLICGSLVTLGAMLVLNASTRAKEEAGWQEGESDNQLTGDQLALVGLVCFFLALLIDWSAQIISAWIH